MLPDSLTDAIAQASESTVTAMQAGSDKIVVRRLSVQLCSAAMPQNSHMVDAHQSICMRKWMPEHTTPSLFMNPQAEVLLGEFWDPSSGAVFAEEGDQQRFWKLTRRFAENLAAMAEDGTRVRAVSALPNVVPAILSEISGAVLRIWAHQYARPEQHARHEEHCTNGYPLVSIHAYFS